MIKSLFRKKSIAQIQADAAAGLSEHAQQTVGGEGGGLRRTLGVFDLTLMGIAAIVGAGIFAMIGKAANNGGPAVALLFVFTAFACGFSALCYAEFASRIPVAGSAYTYAYASMGEFIAWIIGWDLIVEYAIGNIAVAISWSDYFTNMLRGIRIESFGINGIHVPAFLTMDYVSASRGFADGQEAVEQVLSQGYAMETLTNMNSDQLSNISNSLSPSLIEAYQAWTNAPRLGGIPIIADFPALLIVLVITTLVYIGIRESKFASNIMTVLKLGVILLVIFLGLTYVQPANWSPFAPNGVEGVMKGVAAVFFAYIGFDALSTTAEECKNPRRDLPIAMILSLVICTILYIALALVLTGMVSYTKLNVGDPLAFVFGAEGANLPIVAGLIAISAVIALATVFLVFQIGQPRLWMAMSRDGLLPKIFSSIHPKFQTPWFATIITGIVVAVPALFMNLSEVTDLASIGTLFAFVVVCAGVLFKDKEFKESGTRFVPYINAKFILPILFALGLLTLVYFNGVSVLNEQAKSSDLRISATDLSEIEEPNKYSSFDSSNLTNPAVYSAGFGIFGDFFKVNTDSESKTLDFVLPKQRKSITTSKEKIIVVEATGEREIVFSPDMENAKSDKKYTLGFTPFVSEEKTVFQNRETTAPITTENGNAQVNVKQELVKESRFSAFSHKIPMIFFIIITLLLLVLSIVKKLSLIPILGLLSCLYLMTELGITNWLRFGVWLMVGLVIYALYGYRHSKLHQRDEATAEA
jgi:APA family basic amino acid/polyamine antiporter